MRVNIANLREPEFDEGMVKNLIMDEAKKRTLTSLAKSFARRNNAGETIEKPMWSADFVLGKGTGLIFLLHGKPGVGKTLTAGMFRINLRIGLHPPNFYFRVYSSLHATALDGSNIQ